MRYLPALLCLTVAGLLPGTARAAESYESCAGFVDSLPAVITTQGTWCLRKDLSTALSSGAAIQIATNNVTLDCNHFKLGGLQAGMSTRAYGVRSQGRLNVTVRNCTIRGFEIGVWLIDGGGHLVEANRAEGNTHVGLVVDATGSVIRNNLVFDTGGSSIFSDTTYGIRATGSGIQILDNTVSGVVPASTSAGIARGISYFAVTPGTADIGRNWVEGLGMPSQPLAYGITAGGRAILHENRIHATIGMANNSGIVCTSANGLARSNIMSGFVLGVENCTVSGNVVLAAP